MANRQFAVGEIFKYSIFAAENVKTSGNNVQSVQIPWTANAWKANLASIDGKYYDILSVDNTTFAERSTILSLSYNPVCTLMTEGETIGGWFERTPQFSNPSENFQIGNDTLATGRIERLYKIAGTPGYIPSGLKPFWVQITARKNLRSGEESDLCQYGAFVPYSPSTVNKEMGYFYNAAYDLHYPDIRTLMTDIDTALDIPAVSIQNIAISARCPYRHRWIAPEKFDLEDSAGNPYAARETDEVYHWALTQITDLAGGPAENPQNFYETALPLTDFERFCGRVVIVDEIGNEIAIIPSEYCRRTFDNVNYLDYIQRSVADYTGLFTQVQIRDRIFTIPEGQLPWVGDAWANYAQYQMQYDREAATRSIDTVNAEKTLNQANMAASALMSVSNPASAVGAAASLGIGIVTAEMSANISKGNIYAEQVAKEGLIKGSPACNYQSAYGLDYCYRSYILGGAHIRIETPANLTETDFQNYLAYRGWPCNKYTTVQVVTGFIKGNIYNLPTNTKYSNASGPELDTLRREIAAGLRMVIV